MNFGIPLTNSVTREIHHYAFVDAAGALYCISDSLQILHLANKRKEMALLQ
jgi:hypothetical protein